MCLFPAQARDASPARSRSVSIGSAMTAPKPGTKPLKTSASSRLLAVTRTPRSRQVMSRICQRVLYVRSLRLGPGLHGEGARADTTLPRRRATSCCAAPARLAPRGLGAQYGQNRGRSLRESRQIGHELLFYLSAYGGRGPRGYGGQGAPTRAVRPYGSSERPPVGGDVLRQVVVEHDHEQRDDHQEPELRMRSFTLRRSPARRPRSSAGRGGRRPARESEAG